MENVPVTELQPCLKSQGKGFKWKSVIQEWWTQKESWGNGWCINRKPNNFGVSAEDMSLSWLYMLKGKVQFSPLSDHFNQKWRCHFRLWNTLYEFLLITWSGFLFCLRMELHSLFLPLVHDLEYTKSILLCIVFSSEGINTDANDIKTSISCTCLVPSDLVCQYKLS